MHTVIKMAKKNKEKIESNKSKEKRTIVEALDIPEGVAVSVSKDSITVKGKLGEVNKQMHDPKVKITVEGSEVKFTAKDATRKEKMTIGTFMSHTKGLFKGTTEGVAYKLKICSGHFPMNVSISGKNFTVKNFLGEKVPRVLEIREGVKVKIEGDIIDVGGIDKGLVSQTAASIETLTRRVGFDRRRFQDGIYITDKDGKKL